MKSKAIDNPFVVHGYHSPKYFCDRAKESADLIEALENGRNVTMLSPRRMGKTGLIRNVFRTLESDGEWTCVYVDAFSCRNLGEFAQKLGTAVIGSMDGGIAKALNAAGKFFRSMRPVFTVDRVTGDASCSFTVEPGGAEVTLKECFDYLASAKGKCVVAIDEFQQVAEFPERGTEALLRSRIQFLENARFIFAGSKRHLMSEMFSAPKRPFYNSTQIFPLGPIPPDAYFAFAKRHMSAGGIRLDRETFDSVYSMFDGVTWYVQCVLNRLYAAGSAERKDVGAAVERILGENAYNYANMLETLPSGSVKLLRALAAEGAVKEVTAAGFISKHGLGGSSSVRLSLAKLMDAGIAGRNDKMEYYVDDRFFGIWLMRNGL